MDVVGGVCGCRRCFLECWWTLDIESTFLRQKKCAGLGMFSILFDITKQIIKSFASVVLYSIWSHAKYFTKFN